MIDFAPNWEYSHYLMSKPQNMKRIAIACLVSLMFFSGCRKTPAYKNPGLSAEKRAADLLSRMTVDEKIGQLICPYGWPKFTKLLASTWDSDLMEQVGVTVREELCAVGARIAYGPVVDLSREPRWSRVEETYGEDVFLTSIMSSSVVRGMSPAKYGWDKGVIATLKHFVAYGVPQGGHNANVSVVGERDLYENFLPIFKAGIDAGAESVMTFYNSINGIPSTGNKGFLTGVLRDEWDFKGIVVSDLISIDALAGAHRIAEDLA